MISGFNFNWKTPSKIVKTKVEKCKPEGQSLLHLLSSKLKDCYHNPIVNLHRLNTSTHLKKQKQTKVNMETLTVTEIEKQQNI